MLKYAGGLRQIFNIPILIVLAAFHFTSLYSSDTLYVSGIKSETNIYKHVAIFEDPDGKLSIDSIFNNPDKYKFIDNKSYNRLNFGYSTSSFWIKLVVRNIADIPVDYILEVTNPDLDHINFYEISDDSIVKRIETGELHDIKTREIPDRNFLSILNLKPGKTHVYFISANNGGHPFFIPINLKEKSFFEATQKRTEVVFWLINGLLLFIIFFNIYLFHVTKDKVNLYYALYVFFATLTLLSYDGYFYYFNPPVFIEKIKWLNPSLYIVFLLSFTQAFTSYTAGFKWQSKLINPFKVLAIVFIFFYSLRFPYSLVADFGIPVLILSSLVLIILMAVRALRTNYAPSLLLLLAYSSVFLGYFINQLKELNIISSNFFVENSSKFGQTLECILLAVAVLERFRINQKDDKQTIHNNLLKIELQNKELEIINTELEKLSIVASETDNSIAIYDNEGRLEWGNAGFEKLYEVPINDLIKNERDKIELIIPNKKISLYVNKCRESKLPVVFETPVLTNKKQELWIQTTLSPFIRSGKIFKIIAIDSDITSLKTYEKELESAKERAVESDRLKTAFLGNMSHEIRTPLNGIMGFSQLLNENELSKNEIKSYLEIIKTCGDQLIHIIDDVLDISLIESNQLKIYPEEFELKSFMHGIMEFFETYKKTVDKAHILLVNEMKIEDEQCMIVTDPFRLKQVISNLIRNSLKFTHQGQIRIVVYTKDQFLHFYVEDTGIGIDPAKKDILFERFRQGEETLSRKYGGTGLGLSISKGIIEKLGGDIWIDTTYKKGLRISFAIPYKISEKKKFAKEKHGALNNVEEKIRDKNILIVEDHDFSYKYFEEILSPFNPRLTRAINGEEAVEMARNNHYDLILMDINLPVMDGVEATREIRKFSPDLPIFVQTAFAMESEIGMIMSSGCNDLMSKPIDKMEFFEKLLRHL
jgi:signal transduction histidine kinase